MQLFGDVFPEIVREENAVTEIIAEEEESFGRTLLKGVEQFKKIAAKAKEEGRDRLRRRGVPPVGILRVPRGPRRDYVRRERHEGGQRRLEEAFKEAQEKLGAAGKKGGGLQPLFEAEATAWLANNGVPLTDDSHKCARRAASRRRR